MNGDIRILPGMLGHRVRHLHTAAKPLVAAPRPGKWYGATVFVSVVAASAVASSLEPPVGVLPIICALVVAVVAHEVVHIVLTIAFTNRLPSVRRSRLGIAVTATGPMTVRRTQIVLAAPALLILIGVVVALSASGWQRAGSIVAMPYLVLGSRTDFALVQRCGRLDKHELLIDRGPEGYDRA